MKRLRAIILTALLAIPVSAAARDVVVAVNRSVPPYVIVDEWRGLEYDVVREAMAAEGLTIKPKFIAFARIGKELDSGLVDAAISMRPDSGVKAFYSDSHVSYRNYAITLAGNNLDIKKVEDLAGKSVIAFNGASLFLGPAFKAMAETNPRYREEIHQMVQPTLLYLDRVDVVIADRYIFGWFASQPEVRTKADTTLAVRYHAIFPPTDYFVAFRDAALRDSFNRGLKKLRDSGAYERIVERYSTFLNDESGG